MAVSRVEIVDQNLRTFLAGWETSGGTSNRSLPLRDGSRLTGELALHLFRSQCLSRQIDIEARRLKHANLGFYTIGSAGHEGNVVLGNLLRADDPSFLHYRSGAFMIARGLKVSGEDPVYDTMLSLVASSDDPIAGGRHKVWGSRKLWVPPQTSTIASHLPKAVGMAIALGKAPRLRHPLPVADDAIVCCTFGDASVNHAVAQTAFNSAAWSAHQHLPVPILFVCEDNGIGISVRSVSGWVESTFSKQSGFYYIKASGFDLADAYDKSAEAIDICRRRRLPVFLHMETVRLLGHAGSDVETEYLTPAEIEAFESRDPLLSVSRQLIEANVATAFELLKIYDDCKAEVRKASEKALQRPRLTTAEEVIAPLAPYSPKEVEQEAKRQDYADVRKKVFGGDEQLPEKQGKPRHMAMLMNWGLKDMMAKYANMLIFGEDVAKKGGVYHVTDGLFETFGVGRVFNTLLDETTILGLAIGTGHAGFLPVPEIQYLAYFHNAEDQIRGEAGSLQFFSKGQFRNPMVIRIASFGYQKGFGGHFHNDNSIAALRDIPGVVIAAPARGDDAVEMFRTVMAMAHVDGRVVFFLEPIALYMTKDLYETGDGQWLCRFPAPGSCATLGEGRIYNPDGKDLTILTYANGLYLSLRAARTLSKEYGISIRILDLRWLHPLPANQMISEVKKTGRVLIVDECRKSGGLSEGILATLADGGILSEIKVSRVTSKDTYIPLGPAAHTVLPSEEDIRTAALSLMGNRVVTKKPKSSKTLPNRKRA